MTPKEAARELVRYERDLRGNAQLAADDLVFLTFNPKDADFFVEAIRRSKRRLFVIDPDKGITPGKFIVSRIRVDRLAAGET